MPIEIQLLTESPALVTADVVVVGVLQVADKSAALSPALKLLEGALGGALSKLIAKEEFTGKRDQSLSIATLGRIAAGKLVLLGLGGRRKVGAPEMRSFAARSARTGNTEKAKSIAVVVPAGLEGELRSVAEGIELGAYRFTKYFTGERKPKTELARVTVVTSGRVTAQAKAALALGQ